MSISAESQGGLMMPALSEEEAKLYDRQIRLWGVDAQRRMRESNILIVGFQGLNAEVCKNLVLAGVNSVTIVETENATFADLGAHIFLTADDVGKNRGEASVRNISILNPLVKIETDKTEISKKGEDFFKKFTAVCIANYYDIDALIRIDDICRRNKIFVFIAGTLGYQGYFFEDLTSYQFIRKPPDTEPNKSPENVVINYSSLQDTLNVKWGSFKRISKIYFGVSLLYRFYQVHKRLPSASNVNDAPEFCKIAKDKLQGEHMDATFLDESFLQQIAQNARSELSPVCAIIGGVLGQEIIKVISGKDEPLNNFFCYDGIDYRRTGVVETIHPK